jgi:hypothetical protein
MGRGELANPLAEASPSRLGNRVEYDRGALVEWYLLDERGLQQGFTIHESVQSSNAASETPIFIELEIGGDLLPGIRTRDAVTFSSSTGEGGALIYSGLRAWDAEGQELPAELCVEPHRLFIRVRDAGACYPITVDPILMIEDFELAGRDPQSFEYFGTSIAVSGDTLVVGAQGRNNPQTAAGIAYAFVLENGSFEPQGRLSSATPAFNDQLGRAVAVDGNTAVVGAPFDNLGQGLADAGSVTVFVRSEDDWTETVKLTAADAAGLDEFGRSVAISGDTIAIGAPEDSTHPVPGSRHGSVYVFVRSGTEWIQQAKLSPAVSNAALHNLGRSVALSGNTIAAGAPGDDSVLVFVRNGTSWSQHSRLVPELPASNTDFGFSVGLSGNFLAVGAPPTPFSGSEGAAHTFQFREGVWNDMGMLQALHGNSESRFGYAVAIRGEKLAIGSPADPFVDFPGPGSVYFFMRRSSGWMEWGKLIASDGALNDGLGLSVAVHDRLILSGAPTHDHHASEGGAVYGFSTPGPATQGPDRENGIRIVVHNRSFRASGLAPGERLLFLAGRHADRSQRSRGFSGEIFLVRPIVIGEARADSEGTAVLPVGAACIRPTFPYLVQAVSTRGLEASPLLTVER